MNNSVLVSICWKKFVLEGILLRQHRFQEEAFIVKECVSNRHLSLNSKYPVIRPELHNGIGEAVVL